MLRYTHSSKSRITVVDYAACDLAQQSEQQLQQWWQQFNDSTLNQLVELAPEAFLEALSDHIPQGVPPRYEAHVKAIELPRQGRYRLWFDFIVSTPAGVTVTPTVHFCRQDEAGMRIEMVETQTCSTAMPEVAREVLVLGL